MKIYTKTGDRGETGLLGGHRVSKSHQAIELCGELDETNSVIGVALAAGAPKRLQEIFLEIQKNLFVIGAHAAASNGTARTLPALNGDAIEKLEHAIDDAESSLAPMTAFILPGGSIAGSLMHQARTVCRRTERCITRLIESGAAIPEMQNDLIYLNRLADFLFVAARLTNHENETPEVQWLP